MKKEKGILFDLDGTLWDVCEPRNPLLESCADGEVRPVWEECNPGGDPQLHGENAGGYCRRSFPGHPGKRAGGDPAGLLCTGVRLSAADRWGFISPAPGNADMPAAGVRVGSGQ